MSRLFGIRVDTMRVGEDFLFVLTGGTAHIGATATAYSANDEEIVEIVRVPGHREDELAGELARMAFRKLGRTVTVLAGIHIDNASREEITQAVETAREAMREALQEIKG